jgi:hypothetical protein
LLPTRIAAIGLPSAGCVTHVSCSPTPVLHASPPCAGCVCAPHSSSSPMSAPHSTWVVDNQGAPPVVATSPARPLLTPSVPRRRSSLLSTHDAATTPPSVGRLCTVHTSSSLGPVPYAGPPCADCLCVPHSPCSPAPVLPAPILPHQAPAPMPGLKWAAQSCIMPGDRINPTAAVLRHLGTLRRRARREQHSQADARLTCSPSR